MATVTTRKALNLYQLGLEIGGSPSFRRDGDELTSDSVSQSALSAAVAAHVADPAIVPPPTPAEQAAATAQTNGDTLRAQALAALSGNRTYLGLASPTAAQTTAQVKALTRQMNGVIRLLTGALDATD